MDGKKHVQIILQVDVKGTTQGGARCVPDMAAC